MKNLRQYLLSIVLTLGLLSGCSGNTDYQDYRPQQGSAFVKVEEYEDPYLGQVKILVDQDTRIMYIYAEDPYKDGATAIFSVLYDKEGKPRKYQGIISN